MRFDRSPAKKTAEERALEKVLAEYEEHFGEKYVFQIGFSASTEDTIREVRRLIETDQKQALHQYDSEFVY